VSFPLSPEEAALYAKVTNYVREEFNRADRLDSERRRGMVGFALTILQRRLASSPEAIFQSLRRRRERLEERLREEKLLRRGRVAAKQEIDIQTDIDVEDMEDLEDAPEQEIEQAEEQVVDLATAARTIAELEAEIQILKDLESDAGSCVGHAKTPNGQSSPRLSRTIRRCSTRLATAGSSSYLRSSGIR